MIHAGITRKWSMFGLGFVYRRNSRGFLFTVFLGPMWIEVSLRKQA